jgi:hypothetical protein
MKQSVTMIFKQKEVARISSFLISSTNDKQWNKPLEIKVEQKEQ